MAEDFHDLRFEYFSIAPEKQISVMMSPKRTRKAINVYDENFSHKSLQ